MKVLLTFFVLFLFPILISCNSYSGSSDKTVCVDTDALIRNGIIYLPNETKPFTGNNLCKYENGQIKSEGNYKDGKPDGKVIDWYENGQIEAEGNYKDGKLDGKATYWHENGKIKGKVTFKDGKCISGDCSLLLSLLGLGIQEEYSKVGYFLKYLYKLKKVIYLILIIFESQSKVLGQY